MIEISKVYDVGLQRSRNEKSEFVAKTQFLCSLFQEIAKHIDSRDS